MNIYDAEDTVYSFEKMLFKATNCLGNNAESATKQIHILALLAEYVEAKNTLKVGA